MNRLVPLTIALSLGLGCGAVGDAPGPEIGAAAGSNAAATGVPVNPAVLPAISTSSGTVSVSVGAHIPVGGILALAHLPVVTALPRIVASAVFPRFQHRGAADAGVPADGGGQVPVPPPGGMCAPPSTFSYALCTCNNLTQVGGLKVGNGPSGNGSVGVNGFSSVANLSSVAGSWVSWDQWTAGTVAHIGGSLRSGTDAVIAGVVSVGGDLAVRRNLLGVGLLSVGGALRIGGNDVYIGARSVENGRGAFNAPTQPPCGCDPATRFDVAGAVALARTMNDNAARGIPAGGQLDIGIQRTSLDTGRYYFRGVHNIGIGALHIRGNVSIYIDGSLDEIGAEAIRLDPGVTLDLYVSGAVRLVGFTPLGSRQSPSSFRLFVGGSDRLSIAAGLQEFYGSIYAPTAEIIVAGVTVVWGSLFAKEVIAAGVLAINHAGSVATCTPPVAAGDVTATPPVPPTSAPEIDE